MPLRVISTCGSKNSLKRFLANVLNDSNERLRGRIAVYLKLVTSEFFVEFSQSYCADFRSDPQPTISSLSVKGQIRPV